MYFFLFPTFKVSGYLPPLLRLKLIENDVTYLTKNVLRKLTLLGKSSIVSVVTSTIRRVMKDHLHSIVMFQVFYHDEPSTNKCALRLIEFYARFKLQLSVVDCSSNTTFLVWVDRECVELFGKIIADVKDELRKVLVNVYKFFPPNMCLIFLH